MQSNYEDMYEHGGRSRALTISGRAQDCGTPEFKYNQCIRCNISQPVYQDLCGVYSVGPDQNDAGCANFNCPSPTPTPTPTPTPAPSGGGTTAQQACDTARPILCSMDPHWCTASCTEIQTLICGSTTLFVGDNRLKHTFCAMIITIPIGDYSSIISV